MSIDIPTEAVLIYPEGANPKWSSAAHYSMFQRYQHPIFTALILGKPLLLPDITRDLLQHSPYPRPFQDESIQMNMDFLSLLEENCEVFYYPTESLTKLSAEIAYEDIGHANSKRITFASGGNTLYAMIPGTGEKCFLNGGHSGQHQFMAATANFIFLMHQRYGAEFVDPKAVLADFSLQKFIALKNYLYQTKTNQSESEIDRTESVLRYYVPYVDIFDWANRPNIPLFERIIAIRDLHRDSLSHWRVALEKMRKTTTNVHKTKEVVLPIPLKAALEHELTQISARSRIISIVSTLVSSPLLLLSPLSVVAPWLFERKQFKPLSQGRMDFYFYLQSLADTVQVSKTNQHEQNKRSHTQTAKRSIAISPSQQLITELTYLNQIPVEELERIPGIGPQVAKRIIEARPLSSFDELLMIAGIGDKRKSRLMSRSRDFAVAAQATQMVSRI
jgi:hypothetical protein